MAIMSQSMDVSMHDIESAIFEPKRHAACDECRKRKLKCSGESSGCSRCLKQSITCRYSVQKPMGRPPKKRARTDDEGPEVSTQSGNTFWPSPETTPPSYLSTGVETTELDDASQICPFLFWKPGGSSNSSHHPPDLLAGDENHNYSWHPDRLKNPNVPIRPSSSPWPDFSTVSEATAMPFSPPMGVLDFPSLPLVPPAPADSDSASPQCTCLSSLYLCLSHISSIASFPVNSHIFCSLYIAARTAQDVIRCEACPKNFATGVQNVMFTGTLLTVVADAWLRVYNANPVELGMQSAPQEYISLALQSPDPAQAWKEWLHQTVRHAVVGGDISPKLQTPCSSPADLLSLIQEVEDRQRRWHEPGQHPLPNNPLSPADSCAGQQQPQDEKELLCLRVVGSARAVLAKFNFEPRDFPGSVIPDDMKHVPTQ